VRDDQPSAEDEHAVPPTARPRRPRRARLALAGAILIVLTSAAVCVAAVLGHAPAVVVPLVVAICVGCPIFACWDAASALAVLRAERAERLAHRALERLRHTLDALPEIEHPLGY
jgi:hypothetical protein